MSSLKSQWETGSVAATKEEKMEEKKEELNKLRQRICLGRSESMKAVYEKACQDTSKVKPEQPVVDLGREVKAIRIKEKFEKGELVSEVEEENLEKVRKEKEEDLSALIEPGKNLYSFPFIIIITATYYLSFYYLNMFYCIHI